MWCALRPTILFMFRGVSIYYIDSTNHVLLHYFAELVLFIYYRKTPRTQNDNVMEDLCVVCTFQIHKLDLPSAVLYGHLTAGLW